MTSDATEVTRPSAPPLPVREVRTGTRSRTRSRTRPRPESDAGSRHGPIAQLLIALSPLSVVPLAYWLVQWITAPLGVGDGSDTNRLGFGLHVSGPAAADERLFGVVPTVWLQERLLDGSPQWYDAAAALVYVTHFASIPLVTAVVWFCWRDRFRRWVGTVLAFVTIGFAGYLVYPAAPPWLASDTGDIGAVQRVSHVGWDYLHLDALGDLLAWSQGGSNPVAAMPSLHAGAALLVALFVWPAATAGWRTVLVGYALAMGLALVYTGEHYVVDVLAGWLTAVVAVVVVELVRRWARERMT